jgi:hypothetical protein
MACAFRNWRPRAPILRFRHEVELVPERLRELLDDLLRVIGGQLRDMLLRERGEVREQAHVGVDPRADAGALDLEHHVGAVLQGRPVNLSHRSGSERGRVHLVEELFKRRAQIMLDLLANLLEIDRRGAGLELFELSDPLRSEEIRARRKNLTELDEGRPERLEGPAYALGALEVRDTLGVLPPHEPAGTRGQVFETHPLEQILEPDDREDPDDLLQASQIGNPGFHGHLPLKARRRPRDRNRDGTNPVQRGASGGGPKAAGRSSVTPGPANA